MTCWQPEISWDCVDGAAALHAALVGIALQVAADWPAAVQQLAALSQTEQSAAAAPPAPVDPAEPLAPAPPFPAAPPVPAAPFVPPVPIWQAGTLAMQLLNAVQSLIEKQLLSAESIALWLVHFAPCPLDPAAP
jgi:hypothetical protein